MKVYISIVSHGHESLIKQLRCIDGLLAKCTVIIKSNILGEDFSDYQSHPNFHWVNNMHGLGFGHNNNIIFNLCKENMGMSENDFFIVLNPDVYVECDKIIELVTSMNNNSHKFAAINLYKDRDFKVYDNSIRTFPTLAQFASSFLGSKNTAILNKDNLRTIQSIDWAAGSFQAFQANHYERLNGFDERYFMYCEDIDICWRSKKIDVPLKYYPNIKALHLAKHANRKVLSKHFFWHVAGVFRFLLAKHGLGKRRSSLDRGYQN